MALTTTRDVVLENGLFAKYISASHPSATSLGNPFLGR